MREGTDDSGASERTRNTRTEFPPAQLHVSIFCQTSIQSVCANSPAISPLNSKIFKLEPRLCSIAHRYLVHTLCLQIQHESFHPRLPIRRPHRRELLRFRADEAPHSHRPSVEPRYSALQPHRHPLVGLQQLGEEGDRVAHIVPAESISGGRGEGEARGDQG